MKLNTLLFSFCLVFAVTLQTTAQKNTTDSLLTVELEEVEISTFGAKRENESCDNYFDLVNTLSAIKSNKIFNSKQFYLIVKFYLP